MTLNPEQKSRAVEVMREYLNGPPYASEGTPPEAGAECDRQRIALIENELQPLLTAYLSGTMALPEFKSTVDGINKRHELWGFKGVKGQMFFNLLVNRATDAAECDQELKAALIVPTNDDLARSRIRNFASYVKRVGEQFVEAGGSKQGRPTISSVPYFLSYFWQIQDRKTWPVFYTTSVNVMTDLNLWQPTEDLAEDYIAFKHLHEELGKLFTQESGRAFDLYEVEHVFYNKSGNQYGLKTTFAGSVGKNEPKSVGSPNTDAPKARVPIISAPLPEHLPDSFVPPIVAILPQLALNTLHFDALAKSSGTSLPKAFEKCIHAAFTILGYETRQLGQGLGRVPDGIAFDQDNSYAILWDAKARESGYSIGTDDRAIREYVMTQSREFKRGRSLRNIYYAIVSSGFQDDFDDMVRSLKMETDISEVCLLEASALVAMVEAKLRDPLQITLGPDGMQRLFSTSGIVAVADVQQNLTG